MGEGLDRVEAAHVVVACALAAELVVRVAGLDASHFSVAFLVLHGELRGSLVVETAGLDAWAAPSGP